MILLQGAKERVDVLTFSPDGRMLAAPCSSGVQLWRDLLAGGHPTALLGNSRTWTAYFTQDGLRLAVNQDNRIVFHDLITTEAVEAPLELQAYHSLTFNLSPDSRLLVAAQFHEGTSPPGRLFCRPLAGSMASPWTVQSHRWITEEVFLAAGDRMVTVELQQEQGIHRGRRCSIWNPVYVTRDVQTGQVLDEGAGSNTQFFNMTGSPDGRLIAGRRGIWIAIFRADDMATEPMMIRNDSRKEFTGLAFHPTGRYLAATSNNATVKCYDTSTWKVAQTFDWDIGRLQSIAFSPNGMLAAVGGDRGKIVVWDVSL